MQQTNTLPSDVEKRFDEKLLLKEVEHDDNGREYTVGTWVDPDPKKVKEFIASELQEAVKKERERVRQSEEDWLQMPPMDFKPKFTIKTKGVITSVERASINIYGHEED